MSSALMFSLSTATEKEERDERDYHRDIRKPILFLGAISNDQALPSFPRFSPFHFSLGSLSPSITWESTFTSVVTARKETHAELIQSARQHLHLGSLCRNFPNSYEWLTS